MPSCRYTDGAERQRWRAARSQRQQEERRRMGVYTIDAWHDLRNYFNRRGWRFGVNKLNGGSRRIDISREAYETIRARTDLTLLAIEEKHPVEFKLRVVWANRTMVRPMPERVHRLYIVPQWYKVLCARAAEKVDGPPSHET